MSISEHTLQRVDTDRLQRGVEGLASGAYSITVTRQNGDEISAFVVKTDGESYPVTLTALRSFCGCKDSLYRGKTCRHAVSLALYVIRNPPLATDAPNLTLAKVRTQFESAPF